MKRLNIFKLRNQLIAEQWAEASNVSKELSDIGFATTELYSVCANLDNVKSSVYTRVLSRYCIHEAPCNHVLLMARALAKDIEAGIVDNNGFVLKKSIIRRSQVLKVPVFEYTYNENAPELGKIQAEGIADDRAKEEAELWPICRNARDKVLKFICDNAWSTEFVKRTFLAAQHLLESDYNGKEVSEVRHAYILERFELNDEDLNDVFYLHYVEIADAILQDVGALRINPKTWEFYHCKTTDSILMALKPESANFVD